ncbi:phytase [Poseidonocella sp. HB161398]|uniref:phytase n=1 Tax=Poseidonocella sp. HB161398 TaxID=2320855 RepID=UPI0011097669|nr:phytase [Poseidonocella sp. HB161398]
MRTEAILGALAGLGLAAAIAEPAEIAVTASMETAPVAGDADDPAIWISPADPAGSLILGTDKTQGLFVFDLSGAVVADFPDGKLNNVDLRPFELGGREVWIAGATKREDDTLVFYVIDAAGHVERAAPFAFPGHPAGMADEVDDIYGFAMQRLPDGRVFALANYKSGHVFQWQLLDEAGQLGTRLARQWRVPSQPEGMASDDRAGMIYVGEEDHGIWRLDGAPEAEAAPEKVVSIPSACLPRDDVEGLEVYDDGTRRYLAASAQGIHRVALYDLNAPDMPCRALVEIAAGAEIDGVSETDGLTVTPHPLPGHPAGVLVMMDDQNAGFTTNFKLVDWAEIAAGLGDD